MNRPTRPFVQWIDATNQPRKKTAHEQWVLFKCRFFVVVSVSAIIAMWAHILFLWE